MHALNHSLENRGQVARPRSGAIWPAIVIGLILLNAAIVGVTIYFSVSDMSVATEPDYYRQGLNWDQTARLREMSRALGWVPSVAISRSDADPQPTVILKLVDGTGEPVSGAQVTAVAFCNVRSGERQQLALQELSGQPGTYTAPIVVEHAGLWHVRVRAQRDQQIFVHESEVLPTPAR